MNLRPRPAMALILVVSLLCACGTGASPDGAGDSASAAPEAGEVSQMVALVNGQPLYRAFYEQNLNYLRKRIGPESGNVEAYLKSKFDAMEMLISDELLYQEARRAGISAGEPEVQAEFARMAEAAGGESRLLAGLFGQHITRQMAIDGIRKRLTIDKYVSETLDPMLSVTREEAIEYYNENLDSLTPERLVKVYQILIRCPRGADEEVARAARQQALELRRQLLDGASFTVLAREHSEDSSSTMGGSLGFLKKGVLPPELDAVVFGLDEGELSEPVRTDFGYHLVMVGERRGGVAPEFEQVETDCREAVLAGKKSAAIRSLVGRLKQEAEIETYL